MQLAFFRSISSLIFTLKILILRFSSIGDIVLTSPVIRCLKKQLGAEIHFLSKNAFYPILEANPYLSKIFLFQKNISKKSCII